MRIAMSVEHAYDSVTGTGVFIKELVKGLGQTDHRNDYTLFTSKDYRSDPDLEVAGNGRFRRATLGLSHKMSEGLWLTLNWPPVNRYLGEHDIYHSVTPITFPARGGRRVVTVHDLAYIVRPEWCGLRHRAVRHIYRRRMMREVDHFIAISESTKTDMVNYMGVRPERITVILEGVRDCCREVGEAEVEKVLSRWGVKRPYLLVPGEVNPRKNCERVVQAFGQVVQRGNTDASLIFAGPKGRSSMQTQEAVRSLGLESRVKFLGFMGDEDLVGLMNGSTAMVLASLYEGFGLPIVEAMACGTAVITSNVSSMPEVAGDAGILVDPMKEESIAEAMWEVLRDENCRKDLVAKGRERVKRFTWEQTAREHVKLYESLA